MEELMKLLGMLPEGAPGELKDSLKALFQKVTVDAGKAKTDLESYKKGDSEYKKLTKQLKDANFPEDRWDALADELGVKKSLQDELTIYKAKAAEDAKTVRETQKQLNQMKMETVLGRKVEEVAKAYKTPDGKAVKISDRFIDKNELYKQLDLESDILVEDRISKVMKTAYESQSAFMKEIGMEGIPVHQVKVGESVFGSGKALDTSAIRAVIDKSNGSFDAAAQALTMYEQAAKPTGT